MSVKKRVESVFSDCIWSIYENHHTRLSKTPKYRFRPRYKELLALEGIYPNPTYPDYSIRISCRFNDILRCSDTTHFRSCFRAGGEHKRQPFLRCVNPSWAIAFVTDKHGSIMGRLWIRFFPINKRFGMNALDCIDLYRVYGNKLREEDVRCILNSTFVNTTGRQVQISGGLSDDYLEFG